MRFGDILRDLLEQEGISQRKLARELNIAPSTLGNYINDHREPDYETLKKLADYFGVTVDYLIDHSCGLAADHGEDELLRIYRSLTPVLKAIYLDNGRVLQKYIQK